jgi:DASH complex subunit DAD2
VSAAFQQGKMSYAPRHTNVHPSGSGYSNTSTSNTNTNTSFLRQPSQTQTQTQSALQTRINAKRAELENLLQLRDLSANLANQLSTLEQKLGTLKDGAHSVALVLANWENVLRAINLAASKKLFSSCRSVKKKHGILGFKLRPMARKKSGHTHIYTHR